MMNNEPIAREVVLIGGGHSHVIFLKMLGMSPVPGLKVTLISPDVTTPYSGMLPGLVAGHYKADDVFIDLVPLCRFSGAAFIRDSVDNIDPTHQSIQLSSRPDLRYDVLSIDVGITPALNGLSDANSVIPVKPISTFLARWEDFRRRLETKSIRDVGVVGAGAGGVELCLAIAHCLNTNNDTTDYQLHLFNDDRNVLKGFPQSVGSKIEAALSTSKVIVHRDFRVADMKVLDASKQLLAEDGRDVCVDEVFWVTHAAPHQWLVNTSLATDDDGFVRVRDSLQTIDYDNIFAVGDCASMDNYPRPKAGVYAVRQGKPLFQNIRSFVLSQIIKPYRPQKRFLSLISTGGKNAIAVRNGFSIQGNWVWQWKNWIDQRFIQRFTKLTPMKRLPSNNLVAEFDEQMHCGGCGSKVSADLLGEVLADMGYPSEEQDDAAFSSVPSGKLLVQSVDHFRSFVDDPYMLARISVCHAMSDIYACGGEAVSAMALMTLPFAKPNVTRGLLTQLMRGTLDQLNIEGATLTGGHTSEGVELSLGCSVNGYVDEDRVWKKRGARPGDKLILTKALGTGTIFAADMQFKAKGQWVSAALSMMLTSNKMASLVLKDFAVSACTDVTGFGLAGHCLEMLGSDGIGISIQTSRLPIIEGSLECLKQLDISSSLHESNRRSALASEKLYPSAAGQGGELAENHIIFDPQTSGGLLVAVDGDAADDCLRALIDAGCTEARIIGDVTDTGNLLISD